MRTTRTNYKGFTLLELTITIGIFIVIGTIILSILTSTFSGNNRASATNEVTQNGNYALSVITNLLSNTQRFDGIVTTSPACTPTDSQTCCTATGAVGKVIKFTGHDGGVTTLTCNDAGSSATYLISSTSGTLTPVTVPLIDVSQVRLPATSNCSFTCAQVDEYAPPRIDISFTLQDLLGGNSASFRTSVSLRNQNLK